MLIWESFLALPNVHCFEEERTTYAYNFSKVEYALITGQWGRFVFMNDEHFHYSNPWLESQPDNAFRQALIAYRSWLREQ